MKEPKSKIERLWQYKGLFCLALAIPMGHRCGYVRVPDDHEWKDIYSAEDLARMEEWAQKDTMFDDVPELALKKLPVPSMYKDPDSRMRMARETAWGQRISVHGGVTFLSEQAADQWERTVEGGDGIPGGLWIGFDCAHSWDNRDPDILSMWGDNNPYLGMMSMLSAGGEVRTLDYVVAECESMADQILAAHLFDEVAAIVNGGTSDAIP